MKILTLLRTEEQRMGKQVAHLQEQLKKISAAREILASHVIGNGATGRRVHLTRSARLKISQAAKARWARFRRERLRKG